MKKAELIKVLREIKSKAWDEEEDHKKADYALLKYIDDEEVTEAWLAINKWFA